MTQLAVVQPTTQQGLMKPIATPKELITYHEDMTKIIKEALKENTDYGVIPGTKKATLLKPGAERLNIAFGTHPEYELVEKQVDHDRENHYSFYDKYKKQQVNGTSFGLYRYIYKCKIIRNTDGVTIGEGEGVCSTLEAKYISRPRDCENTALKMAQKRAFLAATLHTFGLSDRFTQDMEDHAPEEPQAQTFTTSNGQYRAQSNPTPAPMPAQPIPAPIAEIFDQANPQHLERLEKRLKEMKEIPEDKYDAIAIDLNGKPLTKESFEAAVFKVTVVDTVF